MMHPGAGYLLIFVLKYHVALYGMPERRPP